MTNRIGVVYVEDKMNEHDGSYGCNLRKKKKHET